MHESAYSGHYGEVDDQLTRAGIAPYLHPVAQGERDARGFGPDAIIDACLCLVTAGIDHVYEVDHPIAIVVIVCKVGQPHIVGFLAGFAYHACGVLVAAVAVVASVVGACTVQRDGADDVELWNELSERLRPKIVAGTAGDGCLQGKHLTVYLTVCLKVDLFAVVVAIVSVAQ